MRTLLSADEAIDYIGLEVLSELRRCMGDAVERYRRERAEHGPVSAKTRACTINDYTGQNAGVLDGRSNVILIRRDDGSLRALVVGDRAIIRFKKLTSSLGICATNTGEARAWARQQPLEGFPAATNLIAGYTLDDLGQLQGLYIVCSLNGRRLWAIELDDVAGLAAPTFDIIDPQFNGGADRAIVQSDLDLDLANAESSDEA